MKLSTGRPELWARAYSLGTVLTAMLLVAALPFAVAGAIRPVHVVQAGPSGAERIDASPSTFAVNFTESGLPTGTAWNLTVLGQTWVVAAPWTVVLEPNGSFTYHASASTVEGPWSSAGSFTVAGRPMSVAVPFAPTAVPSGGTAASSSTGTALWGAITASVLLVVVVLVVVAVALRRKGRAAPLPPFVPPASSTPATPSSTGPSEGEKPDDPLGHML
jgi:hypothetical protein